jgi:hypothetical protein
LTEPPEFDWQAAGPLKAAWRRRGEPGIGEVWYGPWCSPKLTDFASHDSVVADAMPWIVDRIAALHLQERVTAISLADVA